jgi:type IV secretory pathway TrbL component
VRASVALIAVVTVAVLVVAIVVVTVEPDVIARAAVADRVVLLGAVVTRETVSATTTVVVTGTVASAVTEHAAPRTATATERWKTAMRSVSASLVSVSMSAKMALQTARSQRVSTVPRLLLALQHADYLPSRRSQGRGVCACTCP